MPDIVSRVNLEEALTSELPEAIRAVSNFYNESILLIRSLKKYPAISTRKMYFDRSR